MSGGLDPITLYCVKQIRELKRKFDGLQGLVPATEWIDIQAIVRAGLAPTFFRVGDQFECLYDGQPTLFDIIGIDHDIPTDTQYQHSLTIQAHDCLHICQFDAAPEALYYAEAGMAAGRYWFVHEYGMPYKKYHFDLTQPVPAGGCLVFPWASDADILDTKIFSYPDQASSAAIESVSISEGEDGTRLISCNDMTRARYGSNNYLQSNIRAWLNSDAAAFLWAPSTTYDRPPVGDPYNGGGFLARLDPGLVAVIGAVNKQVVRSNEDGKGQDLFSDKVFLLSQVEAYAGKDGPTTGELPYAYYAAMAAEPTSDKLTARMKYLSDSARKWWLRSPNISTSDRPRSINNEGQLDWDRAGNSCGVAPAVCIV